MVWKSVKRFTAVATLEQLRQGAEVVFTFLRNTDIVKTKRVAQTDLTGETAEEGTVKLEEGNDETRYATPGILVCNAVILCQSGTSQYQIPILKLEY